MLAHGSTSASLEAIARLNLLGSSAPFVRTIEQIERFAREDLTILVHGETGTGKELTARAIHYLSPRRHGPFIPINCGATPDSLICSELFGHSRGAFTDARECRHGLVAQANKGTLFLDELETMSRAGQVALLRFLQDHEYRPLGSHAAFRADVRVIGATNADLAAMAASGEFRRDLLYRMDGLSVTLPALRERGDDVILLAQAFLERLNVTRHDDPPKTLHPDGITALKRHHWPGNIRELQNLVQREFLITDGRQLRFECLQQHGAQGRGVEPRKVPDRRSASRARIPAQGFADVPFREAKARAISTFEREYVSELLARTRGNVSLAARLAGKERSRFGRLVRKYSLSTSDFKNPDVDSCN
jgi:two-component system, NtrC family, response regulator GlrR